MSTEMNQNRPVFRFINYSVYQDSKKWYQEMCSLKGIFGDQIELWQLLKSNITSVVMNIAAASTKLPSEAKRYLGFSITAANKAVACLDMAKDADIINQSEYDVLSEAYQAIILQLKGFIKAIGNTDQKEAEQSVAQ